MDRTQPSSPKDLQSNANDTDVMASVRAHDRRALEKLYLSYYGPLARFLSRIVAHTGAVDEIINDAFMTVWTCANEFQGESRVAAWIFGIVYRTAMQSKGLHSIRGSRSFAEVFRKRDADFSAESPYIDRLERRLSRLPLEERVTLALAYQMGFSISEIAEITQVAPATVKVRMIQARSGLHPVA
jgi:RNA polymerase sigma-70 factor (ECF subfamily)